MNSLEMTRSRVHRWAQVFTRLAAVFDRLLAERQRPLARSLAHLMQRGLDPFEGVTGDEVPHEFVGGSLDREPDRDDLRAGLRRCMAGGAMTPAGTEELDVLVPLAEAFAVAADDGPFSDDELDEEAIAMEYRHLRHLDTGDQGPGLFPEPMRRAWCALHEDSATIPEPDRRLAFDLVCLRVIRALYSLAIGHRVIRGKPYLDPDNLLLVHRLGEAYLAGHPLETQGGA